MADLQRPPGNVEFETDFRSGGGAFNQWLQVQLRARKLTQRQLAQLSGVDHSTISRLMRGDRVPSLRTATRLAQGLGLPEDLGRLDNKVPGRGSPMARVESALRSDDLLREAEILEIMNAYLAARRRRLRGAFPSSRASVTDHVPPTVVHQVAALRPR
jgi:transcriptional regulator with XRE-family HTH domain